MGSSRPLGRYRGRSCGGVIGALWSGHSATSSPGSEGAAAHERKPGRPNGFSGHGVTGPRSAESIQRNEPPPRLPPPFGRLVAHDLVVERVALDRHATRLLD